MQVFYSLDENLEPVGYERPVSQEILIGTLFRSLLSTRKGDVHHEASREGLATGAKEVLPDMRASSRDGAVPWATRAKL